MRAFERQVERRIHRFVGPVRPADDLAVYESVIAASRSPRWGFTMFSALKLIVAGVIVALFGGLLLMGVLTTQQGEEMVPAAVSASPEPEATTAPKEPTEQPDPSVRTDILQGVALTVEEVEPGVLRVVNDGVRDLAYSGTSIEACPLCYSVVVAGQDGSVWRVRNGADMDADGIQGRPTEVLKVGDASSWWQEGELDGWPVLFEYGQALVGPDGTLWAGGVNSASGERTGIGAFDGDEWTEYKPQRRIEALAVGPDGSAWAVWGSRLGRFADEGVAVTDLPDDAGEHGELTVTGSGDAWWMPHDRTVFRYDGETWHELHTPVANRGAVGPDGTLWRLGTDALYQFDGTEWHTWRASDDLPEHDDLWPGRMSGLEVLPDGRLWVRARGYWKDHLGVALIDAEEWTQYLGGHLVIATDMSPDGRLWMLATDAPPNRLSQYDGESISLYVITPEAVAATE